MSRFLICIVCSIAIWIGLSSCSKSDVAEVRAQINRTKLALVDLNDSAQKLQAVAESKGSKAAIDAAAAAQKALEIAKEELPKLEERLGSIEDGTPWWKIAATALWPLALTLLRTAPGIGGIAAPVAEVLWALTATKKQKEADKA